MIEFEIEKRRTLCFLVKRGEKKNVVIPIESLLPIDYQRLVKMESEGGELMRVMRDTKLDNGVNALVMYESIFKILDAPQKPKVKVPLVEQDVEVKTPAKRGRGRPKKS